MPDRQHVCSREHTVASQNQPTGLSIPVMGSKPQPGVTYRLEQFRVSHSVCRRAEIREVPGVGTFGGEQSRGAHGGLWGVSGARCWTTWAEPSSTPWTCATWGAPSSSGSGDGSRRAQWVAVNTKAVSAPVPAQSAESPESVSPSGAGWCRYCPDSVLSIKC